MNGNSRERPNAEDIRRGWSVFVELVQILKPSYCLFLGVESFNYCDECLDNLGVKHLGVDYKDKISGTYGRSAKIIFDEYSVSLIGIQHPGARISIKKWHEYLNRSYPALMQSLKKSDKA